MWENYIVTNCQLDRSFKKKLESDQIKIRQLSLHYLIRMELSNTKKGTIIKMS